MIVAIALLCVLTLCVVLGVGIGDVEGVLFPEGFFTAWKDAIVEDAGFHMATLALGILLGMVVAAFGGRR